VKESAYFVGAIRTINQVFKACLCTGFSPLQGGDLRPADRPERQDMRDSDRVHKTVSSLIILKHT
jgi:hypothetical protein